MRAVYGSLVGLIISGASGCLLFTDTINVPPSISIDGPAQIRRGREHMYTVNLKDDTQNGTTIDWRKGTTCPASVEEALTDGRGVSEGRGPSAMIDVHGEGQSACVWVVARDRQGAQTLATLQVAVADPQLVVSAPPMVTSGQATLFTASYPDEPDLRARFYWQTGATCEEARSKARMASASGPAEIVSGKSSHTLSRPPRHTFCVATLARDQYDVEVLADALVERPLFGDPYIRVAAPQGQAKLPIFSQVQLSAGEENDFLPDEPVTFTWQVIGPKGTPHPALPCEGVKPVGVKLCFQVLEAGTYRAELTTVEAAATRAAKPMELEAEDRPPCISETDPPFSPTEAGRLLGFIHLPRAFRVLEVKDDGDPVPLPTHPSQRSFIWYVRQPGADGFDWQVNESFRDLIIDAGKYRPLDRIQVRLEYRDRLGVQSPATRDLRHCKKDDPVCEITPGSGCFQWVTWTVDYL